MSMSAAAQPESEQEPAPARRESLGGYLRFVALLVLAVLAFRGFLFTPFTIPSESMLPGLIKGDYLVAAKWPYGWSHWSLPFDAPLIEGTIAPRLPERGDIAIFRHPIDGTEYIKRVIGLPGDRVALRGGVVVLNGAPAIQRRFADFVLPVSPNTGCAWGAVRESAGDGARQCRYARFSETLPGGRSYLVLDFGATPQDDFGPVTVPAGHVFMLGDNRDNSQDSRFLASAGGGVGLVPTSRLVGRAEIVLFSTDGSARWYNPVSWFTAARWNHIGERL
jgi:signal peptidase I